MFVRRDCHPPLCRCFEWTGEIDIERCLRRCWLFLESVFEAGERHLCRTTGCAGGACRVHAQLKYTVNGHPQFRRYGEDARRFGV